MFIAVLVYSFRFISFGFEKYNKSQKEIFSVAQKAVQIALVQFVALFDELKKESSEWPTFGNSISIQFNSIYLFAIENYMNRSNKKQKNYLDSHGEEAQKKLAGL